MRNKFKKTSFGFTKEKFPCGTHMCLIYRDEAERRKIVSQYLDSGLDAGEKVAYFVDSMTPAELIKWLEEMDIEASKAKESKQLEVLQAEQVYCPQKTFVPDIMLDTLRNYYKKGMADGYSGVRGSGEMSWALKRIPGSERLAEYESLINEVVITHPITALCQYDANKFDGATIFDILQVHPYMITRGLIVKNPAYITPQEFLKTYAK